MKIINQFPLAVAWMPCQLRPPQPGLTVVVKGDFQLQHGGTAAPGSEPPAIAGELFHGDDPEQSLRYDADLAPYKPGADVLLVGHAQLPGGQPVAALNVTFGVGRWRKTLSVFGDRHWTGSGRGAQPSEPKPFTAMPLRYEQAYGGPGVPENPLGKGAAAQAGPNGEAVWPLPNIVRPSDDVGGPGAALAPAGFAPIRRTWPQRRMTGTYDDAWLAERWPWFPDDFDWRHFSAAPDDQRLPAYLRGDETLTFQNLHSTEPTYQSRLPGLRARAFLHAGDGSRSDGPLHEVPLALDTLWVDMDAERLVLLWRGHVAVSGPEFPELTEIVVGAEPLGETALPEDHYRRLLADALAAEASDAEPPEAPEATDASAWPEESDDESEADAALEKEIAEAFQKARDQFKKVGIDPSVVDRIEGGEDVTGVMDDVFAKVGISAAEAQKHLAAQKDKMKETLSGMGFDPAILDDEAEDEADAGPLTPDAVEGKVQAGESLAGRDLSGLDLSGRNLAGGDFAGAQLVGANLARAVLSGADLSAVVLTSAELSGADLGGADLTGATLNAATLGEARLTGAVLEGASLKGADAAKAELTGASLPEAELERARLAGAVLDGADLTGARLPEADLTEASLLEAVLDGAELTAARLGRVSAARASFAGANLTDAVLAEGTLDSVDFSGATLDRADFARASLVSAAFAGAAGRRVVFTGAQMTKVMVTEGARLPGAQLRQIQAPGGLFTNSDLSGADFTYAEMPRGDLSGSDLQGSLLHAVSLREGVLMRSNLRGADLSQSDLFRANLQEAELSDSDLSQCNCFEAEFLDAAINRRTRLTGARLDRSKLAGYLEGT